MNKWLVCGLLLAASAINYMDRMTLASVSRRVIEELHLTKAGYGAVEQSFGYAFAAGAILFGAIADRVNTRWLYPVVLAGWSAMGLLTGWVNGAGQLIACRTLLGLFEAGHWPCALRTTQSLLEAKDRTLGNSILQSGTAIGAIVTPLIAAAMLTPEQGSWRRLFWWIGAAGLLWIAAWWRVTRGLDLAPAGQIGNTAGKAALFELLTNRRFWLLALVVSCINGTTALYRVWLPLALQDPSGLGFTEKVTLGRILPAYYLVNDAGCLAAGAATVWLHARGVSVLNARRWVFTVCALLIVPSLFLPALARSGNTPAAIAILFLTAAGSLGVFPCYYALTQELSRRHLGLVTGLLAFFAWVVPSSLQQPLGAHIDRTGSYDIAFQVGAWPVLIAAGALWLGWGKRREEEAAAMASA